MNEMEEQIKLVNNYTIQILIESFWIHSVQPNSYIFKSDGVIDTGCVKDHTRSHKSEL